MDGDVTGCFAARGSNRNLPHNPASPHQLSDPPSYQTRQPCQQLLRCPCPRRYRTRWAPVHRGERGVPGASGRFGGAGCWSSAALRGPAGRPRGSLQTCCTGQRGAPGVGTRWKAGSPSGLSHQQGERLRARRRTHKANRCPGEGPDLERAQRVSRPKGASRERSSPARLAVCRGATLPRGTECADARRAVVSGRRSDLGGHPAPGLPRVPLPPVPQRAAGQGIRVRRGVSVGQEARSAATASSRCLLFSLPLHSSQSSVRFGSIPQGPSSSRTPRERAVAVPAAGWGARSKLAAYVGSAAAIGSCQRGLGRCRDQAQPPSSPSSPSGALGPASGSLLCRYPLPWLLC